MFLIRFAGCFLFFSLVIDGRQVLLGGRSDVDQNDPAARRYAQLAVAELSQSCNCVFERRLATVVSVQKQGVAGEKYYIEYFWADTTCRKGQVPHDQITEERCPFNRETGAAERCKVEIWVQIWRNFTQVNSRGCIATTFEALDDQIAKNEKNSLNVKLQQFPAVTQATLQRARHPQAIINRLRGEGEALASWQEFKSFKRVFNKTYTNLAEMKRRFKAFQANMLIVKMLQAHEKGDAQYGVTLFSDMTPREFSEKILTPAWPLDKTPSRQADIPRDPIPTQWDWRDHGAVTEVKNQGYCGSCWAFSTTGNIEGQWAIKKGKLVSLSEQELLDCDEVDLACNGGLPTQAYKEIMRIGGLESEKQYPYEEKKEDSCQFHSNESRAYINDSVVISKDEAEMAQWLYKNGPMSIGINAFPMQFYFGGISHPWKFFCSPKHLDHGVLIVGYGVKGNKPYWIVKNSWGGSWGEKGYYLVFRGDGTCGLNQMVTSAVVD